MTRKQYDKFTDALVGAIAKVQEMSPALSIHGGQREDIFGILAGRVRQHLGDICPELIALCPEATGAAGEITFEAEDGTSRRYSKAVAESLAQFVEDSKPKKMGGVTTAPVVDDNGF